MRLKRNMRRAVVPHAGPAGRTTRLPDIQKHRGMCSICRHPQLRDIEDDFLEWVSCRQIALEYNLPDHHTVSDHAHAMGMFYRRIRNLHRVLDSILEHVHEVTPTAANILTAVRLAADINCQGEWFAPRERVYTKALFDRMSPEEMEAYAVKSELPAWFREAIGQTNERAAFANVAGNQPPPSS